MLRRKAQVWRELFEGPPLDASVRTEYARRVVGWMLAPLWIIMSISIACGSAAFVQSVSPIRFIPIVVAVPVLLCVTYLRRKRMWIASAAVLCSGLLVAIGVAIAINSVHAPIYQGGIVLLAMVVPLFGNRWALAFAAGLVTLGLISLGLHQAGFALPILQAPASMRFVLYTGNVILSLIILCGMQRLLADALRDAQRKHREAATARVAEAASGLAFHAVFDQASVGMVLLTPAGTIGALNHRAAQWLGGREGELLGQPLQSAPLWNDVQKALIAGAVASAAKGGAARHELTINAGLGAQLVYQINVSPFHTDSGSLGHMIVEVVDVSDLVRTRTMLAQARRLEALGKLSGGVAHDINNMLAAILGACDMMRSARHSSDIGRLDTSRDIIQSSVLRASALTKQLLAFGRQDRFESVEIDVNRLVLDMGRLFERTLHKNVALRITPGSEPAFVRGDMAALENALLNLALNAQDAMPNGGTLTVSSQLIELDDVSSAKLNRDITPGRCVLVCVRDTGTGMSESVRERMFEPFFTTKVAGKGTGLGLPAVHGTVRNHNGAISVVSEEGVGSTVELYFPATLARKEAVRISEERPISYWLGARVLLADDEPLVRGALLSMLQSTGCEVQAVGNGEALIDALVAGATPDVIVTDLMMPGLSGKNLVQMLEATRPSCPLLLITGYTGDDVSSGVKQRSSHRLLRKPFAQAELTKALHELLLQAPPLARAQTA